MSATKCLITAVTDRARVFNTIFRKLVAVLLLFGLLMSLIFAMIMRYSHNVYHQEVLQRFHAGVATRFAALAGWTPSGWADPNAVGAALGRLATANPQFHVFLLDRDGSVLAHFPDNARLASKRVALGPVHEILQARPHLPILGDDPAAAHARQIFSAARLQAGAVPEQYLYVTVRSEEHGASAESLRLAYITRDGAALIGASFLLALGGGLLSLHFVVRPLKQLAGTMDDFRESYFKGDLAGNAAPAVSGDEIDTLAATYRRMAEQIRIQMREIEHADASRREFIANVSHDLRTPLASIHGYLDTLLLKNGTLAPEERGQYLQIALHQAGSLNELIRTLFYLARLDSGQIALQPERFRIDEVVQDVVQKFAPQANGRHIDMVVEGHGALPFVCADLGLIERALSNLIDNALRHTPEGGSVRLHVLPIEDKVWVSVIDSGSGIVEADLPHIFERFYRGNKARGEPAVNAGLGLSIVRRILAMHDETVEAANAPGRGAHFRFSLRRVDGDATRRDRAFSA